jgi:hypothetical protein
MLRTSSADTSREVPTCASTSARAFFSAAGWFSRRDIAHSVVIDVVSVPAANKFCKEFNEKGESTEIVIKCLTKKLFYFAGYLPMYKYSLFIIVFIEHGELIPIYGGLYMHD